MRTQTETREDLSGWSPWRDQRTPILMGLMMSMALIAVDSTILATSVVTITEDLGAYGQFPWLFSSYLLGQAVTVPVYGKVADMLGRKPLLLFGIAVFGLASVGAGLSGSMIMLIIMRALQGVGAGAVSSMSMTVIGDIYTLAQRGKTQGYMASVWAVSAVLGPAIGGFFSQLDAWRFIFFVNVPIAVVAFGLIFFRFNEKVVHRHHKVDYLGAVVITLALTAIVLAILEGGNSWSWASWQTAIMLGTGVVLLGVFIPIERRAAEPILQFSLLRRPLILTTTTAMFSVGAATIGITSFTPGYLQMTTGLAPILAGFSIATMTIGWPLASSYSAHLYLTRGFRFCMTTGSTIAVLAVIALTVTAHWPNPWTIAFIGFIVGLGMGLVGAPGTIAAQNSVGWEQRGAVTAINNFARSLGSAVGAAALGALSAAAVGENPTDISAQIAGMQWVFMGVTVMMVVLWLAATRMPAGRPVDHHER